MRTSRWRRGGVVTILAVGMLLLTHVSPASAVVTGSGSGDGWEYPQWPETDPTDCPGVPPPFGPGTVSGNPADVFELDHSGTFVATGNPLGNTAIYSGTSQVQIEVGTHVISPAGVGPSCSMPIGQVAVTAATLSGTTGNGQVSGCTFTSGSYERVQSAVSFQLDFSGCTVKGNQAGASSTVTSQAITLAISGTMVPCGFLDPDPCANLQVPEGAAAYLTTAYVAGGGTP